MTDDTVEVDLGPYRLAVATGYGPRVTGLRLGDGPEILAVLGPEVTFEHPDSDVYHPHGGHRLWAAPERPQITYAGDDRPCEVTVAGDKVTVIGPPDTAGLAKQITVELVGAVISVGHNLANTGSDAIEAAPWAITQVALGGRAIVPLGGNDAGDGLVASRSLVLWPYTDLDDPRIAWHRAAVVVEAAPGPPLKMGTGPRPGRLGYLIHGLLFTKTVAPAEDGVYADRGAVGQVYVNDLFCELESLGPIVRLDPGATTGHEEVWAIVPCPDLDTAVQLLSQGIDR